MRRSRLVAPVGLCVAALVVAACGGGDDGGSGDGDGRTVTATDGAVTVEASEFEFDPDRIVTASGSLEVTLVEIGTVNHTFVIEGIDEETFKLEVNGDERDTGSVELEPGEYEFFCDVPGHRSLGMEGTLVVE